METGEKLACTLLVGGFYPRYDCPNIFASATNHVICPAGYALDCHVRYGNNLSSFHLFNKEWNAERGFNIVEGNFIRFCNVFPVCVVACKKASVGGHKIDDSLIIIKFINSNVYNNPYFHNKNRIEAASQLGK